MVPKSLDQQLRRLEASDAFSGVVRITVGGVERFAGAYGFASRAWREPNTMATRFDTGAVTFLEKEGINPGVSGLVRWYPARDLTVVMLSNLENGVWDPIRAAHEMIVGGAFD